MEDLRRQQQDDRERIRALEKQLNAMEIRHRQDVEGLRRQSVLTQGCCDLARSLQNRMTDVESKIDTTSGNVQVLRSLLEKGVSNGPRGDSKGGSSNGSSGHGGGGPEGSSCENSCPHLEQRLKEYILREVGDLRSVFLDRFDDQDFRITAVELDMGLVKTQAGEHGQKMENITTQISQRLKECGCGGGSPPTGDQGAGRPGGGTTAKGGGTGGSGWRGGEGGVGNGGGGEGGRGGTGRGREGERGGAGESGGGTGEGGRGGAGGEKTVEKSLEWRVVANEDQIRHFNTRLRDLSVSGDSLQDQVRPANLTPTHFDANSHTCAVDYL